MAKRTLLDMVQTILSDMVAGRVNHINDSEESEAVADILRRTYLDLIVDYDLPSRKNLLTLTPAGGLDTPTLFRLPTNVYEIEWLKYDLRTDNVDEQIRYTPLAYISPDEFFARNSLYNSTDANIKVVTLPGSSVKVFLRTDANPSYWTSFDNEYVVLDGYNEAIEARLQESKIASYGVLGASWENTDNFIPDLPEHLFPILLATAENRAFEFIKQTSSRLADKQERRSRRRYQVTNNRVDRSRPGPNYGR